jgi:hypothetical protein
MAWDDSKGTGSELTATEWNNHVTFIKSGISGTGTAGTLKNDIAELNYISGLTLQASGGIAIATNISGTNVYGKTKVESITFSGTNVYGKTLVQADTLLGDVVVSGLVISGGATNLGTTATTNLTVTGSVNASAEVFGTTISGTNVYGKTLVQADTIRGDVAISGGTFAGTTIAGTDISGTNLYAKTTIQGDNVVGDVVVSGLVISGGNSALGNLTSTDTTVTGELDHKKSFTAEAAFTNGGVGYYTSNSAFDLTDADAGSTSTSLLAMATATIASGAAGNFLLRGRVFNGAWTFTAGDIVYLGTDPGSPTATAPSGGGDTVRVIGYALAGSELYFDPDKSWVTVSGA